MNRTILEQVICVLSFSRLPRSFLLEAISTACYLINRSPASAIGLKTLMEIWLGHPANHENLRIFGCVAYAHVKQGKIEPRAKKCMFLGYPEKVKDYKLWCLLRRVIKR